MQRANKNIIKNILFFNSKLLSSFLLLITSWHPLFGQNQSYSINLKWNTINKQDESSQNIHLLSFEDCVYNQNIPVYYNKIKASNLASDAIINIKNETYSPLNADEFALLANHLPTKLDSNQISVYTEKNEKYIMIHIPGVRKNKNSGKYEKLISFTYSVSEIISNKPFQTKSIKSQSSSPLANGAWYAISVDKQGVYKITYDDLVKLGMNPSLINPQNIRIFNDGGGMLPERNLLDEWDRFPEIPIYVYGESDGQFNKSDYILFYASTSNKITFDTLNYRLTHQLNLYDNTNTFFLTVTAGKGKRIQNKVITESPNSEIVSSFIDYAYIESDSLNMIKSGRKWYGHEFSYQDLKSFKFNFPNIDKSKEVIIEGELLARSDQYSTFDFSTDVTNSKIGISKLTSTSYESLFANEKYFQFSYNPIDDIQLLRIKYNKEAQNIDPKAWINFIKLNAYRKLIYTNNQFLFRYIDKSKSERTLNFSIQNTNAQLILWDISDYENIQNTPYQINSSTLSFSDLNGNKEYLLFDLTNTYSPTLKGTLTKQDLHGLDPVDFIIIAPELFTKQAEKLAQFHRTTDGLTVKVISPQQIYNEFSFGRQDITAIRNFVRLMYEKRNKPDDNLKYLLLFGDGSYDPKGILTGKKDLIPSYQSEESLSPTGSFVSDDYYGLLDIDEGERCTGLLDIGVGRFMVQTVEEAEAVVDKTIRYATQCENNQNKQINISNLADWRNVICFVADDDDQSSHLDDAESLVSIVKTNHPELNINKIYFDAYKQISTAGGQRYPEVTEAINRQVEKGALIINYSGHGGEIGWSHERVLGISDINKWTNYCNMPIFMTATCEFSRWDDPKNISAGEYVLLNPYGGGVALFSTTRLVYQGQNRILNRAFYEFIFNKQNNSRPFLGDVVRNSKNKTNISNNLNFTLIGDPALQIGMPFYNVRTTSINGKLITNDTPIDTLKALSKVKIEGEIRNNNGQLMENYNGIIYPVVFDKESILYTLENDEGSKYREFGLQKNILFKGKSSVQNGKFSYEFIVPKDMSYKYGNGKFSFYATNEKDDAGGYTNNFIVGGINENAEKDSKGPDIQIYLNNDKFVDGGITDENPTLIAQISDSSGVNTVGNGIGHDITAVLDENTTSTIVLNEYYEATLNDYQTGKIQYQFKNLKAGPHSLKLKVWDIHNNSSEISLNFIVTTKEDIEIKRVYNYPNPFTTNTYFGFEHNQPNTTMNVMIQIYTATGKLIKTIEQTIETEGYTVKPINNTLHWDGKDDFSNKLGKGVYFYKLSVQIPNGKKAEKIQKIVIL